MAFTPTEIQAAYTGLNGLITLARSAIAVRDFNKLSDVVTEMNKSILSAQTLALSGLERQTELVAEVSRLEAEVAELKKWDRDKAGYEMHQRQIAGGTITTYRRKEPRGPDEQPHEICPKCYENRKRSILQMQLPSNPKQRYAQFLFCPSCKTELWLG